MRTYFVSTMDKNTYIKLKEPLKPTCILAPIRHENYYAIYVQVNRLSNLCSEQETYYFVKLTAFALDPSRIGFKFNWINE